MYISYIITKQKKTFAIHLHVRAQLSSCKKQTYTNHGICRDNKQKKRKTSIKEKRTIQI